MLCELVSQRQRLASGAAEPFKAFSYRMHIVLIYSITLLLAVLMSDLLRRSAKTTYCNYKGWATYWTVVIGDTVVDDVAWTYDDPFPESLPIKGCFSFDLTRADVLADLPSGG